MTPPLDLAALRALVEQAKHGPVARRMIASAQLAEVLPALLDRLERAERVVNAVEENRTGLKIMWHISQGYAVNIRIPRNEEVELAQRAYIEITDALTPTPEHDNG